MNAPQAHVATSQKTHCNTCGGQRNATVRGHHVVQKSDDEAGLWSRDDFWILECCGCESVSFRIDHQFSEIDDIEPDYWPSPVERTQPKWLHVVEARDEVLHRLLVEMYAAANGDQRVLAAIGARTVFDRASELMKVKTSLSFADKLKKLVETGKISADEREVLGTLVDAGSAAAHRAWRPSIGELSTMLDVVDAFLNRCFVLGGGVQRLKKAVPKRRK